MAKDGTMSLETTIWVVKRTKQERNHPKTPYFPTFFNAWQSRQNSIAYMYETNKGDYIMALEGVYTKEFVYEEFKKLKTNKEKVKYLIDLKQLKIDHPKIFSMKITLKQIENLIREWNSPQPFAKMNAELAEREEREKQHEKSMRGD